jgi:HK97 family phage major capsid protein
MKKRSLQLKQLADTSATQADNIQNRISKIESRLTEFDDVAAKSLVGGQSSSPTIWIPGQQKSNSYEQKMLGAFGSKSLPELLKKNAGAQQFAGVDIGMRMALISLKEHLDISRWISQIFYGDRLDKEGNTPVAVKNILNSNYAKEYLVPMLKAFGSTVSGAGDEWVPTGISTQYVEEFELEKRVAMMFREMPMPTNPFELPVQNGVTVARRASEGVAMTGSNFGTTKITWNAFKLGEFYALPEELNEDSAPAILGLARTEVVEAQVRARETILLNGDDTGPHMDSDTTAADDARRQAKGLRKLALANTANGGDVNFTAGAITTANLDKMRSNMAKFGVNVRDLVYIFGPTGYHQAVSLPEVTSVEKFGNNATILTGTLAAFRGIPVVVSDYVREDLQAGGYYDGVTTDKAVAYLVNLKRFWIGRRRPIQTRVMMDLADHDRWLLASYQRMDFKGHAQSATETSIVVGRNIQT